MSTDFLLALIEPFLMIGLAQIQNEGDDIMSKENMKSAVLILKKYFEGKSETERNIFLTFLEGIADSEGQYYCMDKLHTLAEVIKEQDCYFLIDELQKYDYKASLILDELLKE